MLVYACSLRTCSVLATLASMPLLGSFSFYLTSLSVGCSCVHNPSSSSGGKPLSILHLRVSIPFPGVHSTVMEMLPVCLAPGLPCPYLGSRGGTTTSVHVALGSIGLTFWKTEPLSLPALTCFNVFC
jgi:hypothetical protein